MSNGFQKFDNEKLRWSLLFHPLLIPALEEMIAVLMYGASKYGEDNDDANWARCDDPGRYWNAEMRHKAAEARGEWNDPESGHPHQAHKLVSGLFKFALDLQRQQVPARVVEKLQPTPVKPWLRQDDEDI